MNTKIGLTEAKTKFPELLGQVKVGKSFTITYYGEAVADLVPNAGAKTKGRVAAVEEMREFMRNNPPLRGVNIKKLIEEGRD